MKTNPGTLPRIQEMGGYNKKSLPEMAVGEGGQVLL